MSKSNKKALLKILLAAGIFAFGSLYKTTPLIELAIFLTAFLIVGLEVVISAVRNILRGQVFDENFLMSIATIGAFFVGEYPEGVAVMLFFQVGELFQNYAVNKSRKSIAQLMDIRPDFANVKRAGEILTVDPNEVKIGEIIVIKPGEKVPLDAMVIEGTTNVDTSALTGESLPRETNVGDNILSGCININGVIFAKVEKEFAESTVSKILDLVENASSKKSNSENFITKFARYYTPIVVIIAAFLAVVPPLILQDALWGDWIYRALIFLVISCPCALVISVPLSFFGGIGGASKRGILVKGSNYLEALSNVDTVVFDKTGTLTKGVFEVVKINADKLTSDELLEIAAYAENYSTHPISLSLKKAYGKIIDTSRIGTIEEIAGHGVVSTIDGEKIGAGNTKLMKKLGIDIQENTSETGSVVHFSKGDNYIGNIVISDILKPDAAKAIEQLKQAGIKKTAMLTGDTRSAGEKIGKQLGLDMVVTELLPAQKVEEIEKLLMMSDATHLVCYVGDGINDAPVLARADVGIAMGGLGSDAAIEAADIVIMTDEPSKISTAIKISKKTLKIVKQNIVFAIGIKIFVLALGAVGFATMWDAVFADVGVSVIAILNSIRALNTDNM